MKMGLTALVCCLYIFGYGQAVELYENDEFEQSKGKLPWPVEHVKEIRQATEKKSLRNHATAPFLTIYSDSAFTVKACATGIVSRVFDIDGSWAVLLKHGNYISVYSNLNTVFVRKGEAVVVQQALGQVNTRANNDEPFEFDLLFYKDNKSVDPYPWLVPRILL